MTLELDKIVRQVEQMGQVLAERAGRERQALPAAQDLLHRFADQREFLVQVAASDAGRRLRCASPQPSSGVRPDPEPLDAIRSAPDLPEHTALIAVDGSQIYPDRHGLAFYYAINVGCIVYRHGSGQAPQVGTEPRVFFLEEDVYPDGEPVTADLVSAQRGLAEMQQLVNATLAEGTPGAPCVALADGPLLLWLQGVTVPARVQARILAEYLTGLDQLRAASAAVAGFVSRPHSAEVVALLCLAESTANATPAPKRLADTRYRGLTDRALFGFLAPGQRSALFVRGAAANDQFHEHGHTICTFYLNTGADLARVEVPLWVAHSADRLDLIHAAVYEQCRLNNGYPYILTRADELAVILGAERDGLESMIVRAMLRRGLDFPVLSQKAQQKKVARWRRGYQ